MLRKRLMSVLNQEAEVIQGWNHHDYLDYLYMAYPVVKYLESVARIEPCKTNTCTLIDAEGRVILYDLPISELRMVWGSGLDFDAVEFVPNLCHYQNTGDEYECDHTAHSISKGPYETGFIEAIDYEHPLFCGFRNEQEIQSTGLDPVFRVLMCFGRAAHEILPAMVCCKRRRLDNCIFERYLSLRQIYFLYLFHQHELPRYDFAWLLNRCKDSDHFDKTRRFVFRSEKEHKKESKRFFDVYQEVMTICRVRKCYERRPKETSIFSEEDMAEYAQMQKECCSTACVNEHECGEECAVYRDCVSSPRPETEDITFL